MSEFVRYALLANAGVLLVWVAYRLFLHGNTLHWCNRAYLMFGTALAVIAPFVPAGTTTQEVIGMQLPEVTISQAVQVIQVVSESWTWLAIGYFAGALLMLAYQSEAFFNVWRIISRSLKSRVCGVAVYRSADAGPFSFFGIIHIPLDSSNTGWLPFSFDKRPMHELWKSRKLNVSRKQRVSGRVFFNHNYGIQLEEAADIDLKIELKELAGFSALVHKDNIMAFQFHPEKSQIVGELLLKMIL
jgi:hypothetical protein